MLPISFWVALARLACLMLSLARWQLLLEQLFTWRMRRRPALALLGPVIANALIVPAYLPLMLQGMGFYTIPFTTIALDGQSFAHVSVWTDFYWYR